jgi:hypothetical protein
MIGIAIAWSNLKNKKNKNIDLEIENNGDAPVQKVRR